GPPGGARPRPRCPRLPPPTRGRPRGGRDTPGSRGHVHRPALPLSPSGASQRRGGRAQRPAQQARAVPPGVGGGPVMIRVLLWKEYREQRAVWLTLALLVVGALVSLTRLYTPAELEHRWLPHFFLRLLPFLGAWTYGLVCGAMLMAG